MCRRRVSFLRPSLLQVWKEGERERTLEDWGLFAPGVAQGQAIATMLNPLLKRAIG